MLREEGRLVLEVQVEHIRKACRRREGRRVDYRTRVRDHRLGGSTQTRQGQESMVEPAKLAKLVWRGLVEKLLAQSITTRNAHAINNSLKLVALSFIPLVL